MQVAPEGTPVRPQPRTQRAAGLAPVAPPVSVTPPLEAPAHGDPEAVVRRHQECLLLFPVGVVCEWSGGRAQAFTMSVPAFIDISEEDQVCSRAAGAAQAGVGESQGREGLSRGRAAGRRSAMPAPGLRAAAHACTRGIGEAARQECAFLAWGCPSPVAGSPRPGPEAPRPTSWSASRLSARSHSLTTQSSLGMVSASVPPNAATSGVGGGEYLDEVV